MRKKCRYVIWLAMLCVFCAFPQKAAAAEKEYDFNKKKSVTIAEADSYGAKGSYTWLKFKPGSDGYLSVTISAPQNAAGHATGYIALFDEAKRTALSSKSIFYNSERGKSSVWRKFIFGMQKGKTYYLRIRGENAVTIERKFTKTKDSSGAMQAAAKALKKNKAKIGLIPAGTSQADWYKVTISKKQKIRFYYTVKASGTAASFRISIYSGKKRLASRNVYCTSGEQKYTLCWQNKTTKKTTGMDAGTYHVKIERANATSSGYYKVKWK